MNNNMYLVVRIAVFVKIYLKCDVEIALEPLDMQFSEIRFHIGEMNMYAL